MLIFDWLLLKVIVSLYTSYYITAIATDIICSNKKYVPQLSLRKADTRFEILNILYISMYFTEFKIENKYSSQQLYFPSAV